MQRQVLWLLLLTPLLGWADEGEWDASGEYLKPPPKQAQKAEPATVEAILAAIKSDKLRPYTTRLAAVMKPALAGEFEDALALARRLGNEAANVPVTQDDLRARAVLAALYQSAAAELQALLGQVAEGRSTLRRLETQKNLPKDLRAQVIVGQGYLDVLQHSPSSGVPAERRARGVDPVAVQPVIEAIAALYRGQPAQAFNLLRAAMDKGQRTGYAGLYAAAAALALGRPDDAAACYGRREVAEQVGHLPHYHLIGGLLDAAQGEFASARGKLRDAATREHGRVREGGLLAAVADLALGQGPSAAQAIQANLSRAPRFQQPVLQDLVRQPTAARARQALQTARFWFCTNGYSPGAINAPTEDTRAPAGVPSGAAAAPATAPTVPGASPLPDVAPPAPGGAAPAAGAAETPAGQEGGEDLGVDARALSTQAAQAYDAALRFIGQHRLYEAELALVSAVRMRGFAEAWLALGQVRLLRGATAQAASDFRQAAGLRPNWSEAVYSVAMCEDLLGQPTAARSYTAALALGLPDRLAAYARQRLAALSGAR